MAVCMILTASSLSWTDPMCQPPRQMIDTFTPVFPSGRCGMPADGRSCPPASDDRARAAVPTIPAWRNSRRLLSALLTVWLLGRASGREKVEDTAREGSQATPFRGEGSCLGGQLVLGWKMVGVCR